MITVYSAKHQLHHPKYEFNEGELVSPYEKPLRVENVLAALAAAKIGELVEPSAIDLELVKQIHSADYVDFLQSAYSQWQKVHGDRDALPLCWPTRRLHQMVPENIDGKLGYYSFDAGTAIVAGTWQAVTASASVAATGAAVLNEKGGPVFSLCRPPGHHAAQDLYGGYCFLNNAAIAAQKLLNSGAERVAILDVDYHHGNGTQSIFYDRADVLFVSLHADPRQEYPYFSGYATENGIGAGEGFNMNLPLPWGTDWSGYSQALDKALLRIKAFAADALVVSLGVDAYERDPISRFKLSTGDFMRIGAAIGQLKRPTLVAMEGGYCVEAIGANVVNFLIGLQAG